MPPARTPPGPLDWLPEIASCSSPIARAALLREDGVLNYFRLNRHRGRSRPQRFPSLPWQNASADGLPRPGREDLQIMFHASGGGVGRNLAKEKKETSPAVARQGTNRPVDRRPRGGLVGPQRRANCLRRRQVVGGREGRLGVASNGRLIIMATSISAFIVARCQGEP
jgi:hypothetical protein